MQNDPLKDIEKKTQRYWYEDGIWEIAFGTINLVLSGFFLITSLRSWEGPMALVLLALQMVVIVGIFALMNRMVRWMKERITYPRTGYVAYRKPDRSKRLRRMARAALTSAAIAAAVGATAAIQSTAFILPIVVAAVMAAGLAYIGYRFGLLRMYALAIITVILGSLVAMLPIEEDLVTFVFFGSFGLLLLISGAITMLIYLRRTQPQDEAPQYEDETGSAPGPEQEPRSDGDSGNGV